MMSVITRALVKRQYPDRPGNDKFSRKELKALAQHDAAGRSGKGYKAKQPHWIMIDVKGNNLETHYLYEHSVTKEQRVISYP